MTEDEDYLAGALGLHGYERELRRLIREARRIHRLALDDWRQRNDNPDKPHKRLEDNWDDAPTFDYGPLEGEGLPPWDRWYREHWGRPRGNPGGLRDGSGLPNPPLVAVYHLVNRWYRLVLGKPFRPDFSGSSDQGLRTDAARFEHLNLAAKFFVLVAQEADTRYTIDRCRRVNDEYYKRLKK